MFGSAAGSCEKDGKALIPECSTSTPSKCRRAALIRGEPGARLTLRWARLFEDRWKVGV
jgi:hypothetical protein